MIFVLKLKNILFVIYVKKNKPLWLYVPQTIFEKKILKDIICNHNNLHYSYYILNNDINILNLILNTNLIHDGLQNGGKIIEINDNIENIIKNNICYIFLISRVKN